MLQELQAEAPKATIHYQEKDLTNRANVESTFKAIHNKFGYVDIFVKNAAVFDEQNCECTFAANVVCIGSCWFQLETGAGACSENQWVSALFLASIYYFRRPLFTNILTLPCSLYIGYTSEFIIITDTALSVDINTALDCFKPPSGCWYIVITRSTNQTLLFSIINYSYGTPYEKKTTRPELFSLVVALTLHMTSWHGIVFIHNFG